MIFKLLGSISNSDLSEISSKTLYISNIDVFKNDASEDVARQYLDLKIILKQNSKELFFTDNIFFNMSFRQIKSITKYSSKLESLEKEFMTKPSEFITIACFIIIYTFLTITVP